MEEKPWGSLAVLSCWDSFLPQLCPEAPTLQLQRSQGGKMSGKQDNTGLFLLFQHTHTVVQLPVYTVSGSHWKGKYQIKNGTDKDFCVNKFTAA